MDGAADIGHGHLSASAFRGLARERLLATPPLGGSVPLSIISGPSDFDLNPDAVSEFARAKPPRPAAVLVPVIAREALTLLFTLRTDHLPTHAGQISFPGGRIDPGDSGPIETALREAEEEIGLSRALVEPLGFLDAYRTGTGYCIAPVVALVSPDFTLAINAGEVADVFEVPLSHFTRSQNYLTEVRTIAGKDRRYYAIPYLERYIWGATAGILKAMHKRLFTT